MRSRTRRHVEPEAEPTPAESAEENQVKRATKKAKEPKAKKPAALRKPRKPAGHPSYEEMIKDAIVMLKEMTGSSQYANTKFIEGKQKNLPATFKNILLFQLKKLIAAGKILKVKGFFKLPSAAVTKKPAAPTKVKSKPKPKTAAAKPKPKASAAKPKIWKPSTPAKSKSKKAEPAAKPKAEEGRGPSPSPSAPPSPTSSTASAPSASSPTSSSA